METTNYLIKAVSDLLTYTTPQSVFDYIKAEQIKVIIGNPPICTPS